jgi:hypothetical protein
MVDTEDAYGAVLQREQDAVISEAEPNRTGQVAVQCVNGAGAGAGEMEHALKNAHGGWTAKGADIGAGLIELLDPIPRHLPGVARREREVFRLCAELGEDIVHRNAAALCKPKIRAFRRRDAA